MLASISRLHESVPVGVELFRVDIDFNRPLDITTLQTLSWEELQQCQRFREYEDRCRFAVIRNALRNLLSERLGLSPAQIKFETNSYGKPSLASTKDVHHTGKAVLQFNVSHSGKLGVIAISSEFCVGVDVEKRLNSFEINEESVFSSHEKNVLAQLVNKDFYDYWTLKESVAKALGYGLTLSLPAIQLRPDVDAVNEFGSEEEGFLGLNQFVASVNMSRQRQYQIFSRCLDVGPDYAAAFAWLPLNSSSCSGLCRPNSNISKS